MIRYHFDLYPRDEPRDGARIVRFTKLQMAEYRGEANGTGAGRFSIRADEAEAQNIDPLGLQYVRVVREDTVAATEVVVGGFFLDSGDFKALDERGTRLLTFGGAGVLSYLAREIMWSHTYRTNGNDPTDDVWTLEFEGAEPVEEQVPLEEMTLGRMLYRVMSEALDFPTGAYFHHHWDGTSHTDTHDDDKTESAVPDLDINFSMGLDSAGNAWPIWGGEFHAQVGESILSVVRRMMETGIYVEMDPDTFELNAYDAATHGRTRTGSAWGTNVVRFQTPTGEDISTGNIKSDADRKIQSFVKRSTILAGGDNVFGTATQATDIVWHGFYPLNSEAEGANELAAEVQLAAREDAGDVVQLRIRLGTDPANGSYLPFEHILLDDNVTLHTGETEWDFNEQTFPVAALTLKMRQGGDWDAWVDLGTSYSSLAERQFKVPPVAAHNHPPNPELCRPGTVAAGIVPVEHLGTACSNDGTSFVSSQSGWGLEQRVAITLSRAVATGHFIIVVTSDGQAPDRATAVVDQQGNTYDLLGSHQTTASSLDDHIQVWLAQITNPLSSGNYIRFICDEGGGNWGGRCLGAFLFQGVAGTVTAGTGSGTIGGTVSDAHAAGALVIAGGTWADTVTPTADSDYTAMIPHTEVTGSGIEARAILAQYRLASPADTWSVSISPNRDWAAIGVAIESGSTAVINDGHPDLVGTSPRAARCDHRHDVHRESAPTVNDDWATQGYKLGTIWAQLDDLENPTEIIGTWMLVDITEGAAVWLPLSAGLTEDDIQDLIDASTTSFLTKTGGEKHTLNTVASSGTTETLDLANGNLHDVTLTDDCTFTFTGATNGVGCYLTLILRQDGTGGHAVTWPASIEWPGGNEPDLSTDADAVDVLSFLSDDGGTTWFGMAGGSGGGGGASGRWELVMSPGVTSPPVPVENPDGDDWVYIFVED